MNENPSQRLPRRRWFRFSLRTLLLLVTVLGMWLGLHLHAMRRQQESIAAIKNIGGACYYDFQEDVVPGNASTSLVPSLLRKWLGDDFFHDITIVNLTHCYDAKGQWQKNLLGTGEDLKHLAGFPKLKVLFLHNKQASNAGLAYVGKLSHLEKLYILHAPDLGDEGVAHLSKLHKLKCVLINDSQITDDSLKVFASMPSLQILDLEDNHFTNHGLAHLSHMGQLISLNFGRGDVSGITDEGLAHLEGLENLEELGLAGTGITSAGLKHLKGLKKLRALSVPADVVSSLETTLPNYKINQPVATTPQDSPVANDE